MADAGLRLQRLRAYLGALDPHARALLAAEIARGAPFPGAEMVSQVLQPTQRPKAGDPVQLGAPAQLFFQPLAPFLSDAGPGCALPGRIERSSIPPLWQWIERILAPEEAADYVARVADAMQMRDQERAEAAAAGFQDAMAASIGGALGQARADERFRRRLAAQIALPHALDDLTTLHRILLHRQPIARLAAELPASIANLTAEQAQTILERVRSTTLASPELLLPGLILVHNRLAATWQLIRLALAAAQTDSAARIQQTPFALAVTLVLADLDCSIEAIRTALHRGLAAEATAQCKRVHDAVRGLRSEIDLSGESSFARELAALRRGVSDLLRTAIEPAPGRLRRLLRPSAKGAAAAGRLDPVEVAETEALIELVNACRNYAGELALNQIAPRIHAELQAWFDAGMPVLLEALRRAGPADRAFRQSQVDAAARFAGKLFGAEYAALLAKAAALAAAETAVATA